MKIPRLFDAPGQSFFLMGPRGVGKSTCLRDAFAEAHTINLLAEETYQRLLANPGLFAAELRAVDPERWVIVDEIQRLPALLNEVHRFIEERGLRFVVYPEGPELRTADGIEVVPFCRFAELLAAGGLWR